MKVSKIITAIVSAVLFVSCVQADAAAEDSSGYISSSIDGRIEITGFSDVPDSVTIPESIGGEPVCIIRDNAFYRCEELRRITLPKTLNRIGHHAFFGCISLESTALPESLTSLGMGAFSGCTSLTCAVLPETLTAVPDDCFSGCTSLETVVLGSSLKEIGSRAFFGCTRLDSIYIPQSVESIDHEAFLGTNTVITGVRGSTAERFAAEHGIVFTACEDVVLTAAKVNSLSHTDRRFYARLLVLCGMVLLLFGAVSKHVKRRMAG